MFIQRLSIRNFRSYGELDLDLSDGTVVLLGDNGVGKSNLLEAIGYGAHLESFRGAPSDALVARGSDQAIVRAAFMVDEREMLVEAEISRTGRNRVLLNRQRLARTSDLLSALPMTVFAPTDLELIKGGPALRRGMLDRLLSSLDHRNAAVRAEFERALKQRNALLKGVRGRLDESAEMTLDVWDSKLASSGGELARLRIGLISDLAPVVARAYHDVAGQSVDVDLEYHSAWTGGGLAAALAESREDDLRRGVTLVGPHRDDLSIVLDGMPARTHASQGEQRTMALALRLASHRMLTDRFGYPPILLLDDVFSELDDNRSAALLAALPGGQRILTTAVHPPSLVHIDQLLVIDADGVHVGEV